MCIVSLIPSPLSLVVCDLVFFSVLSSATPPFSSVSSYNHPRLFNTLSSFPSPLTLHPFLRGRALRGITFPDILCLPLTPTPATTNAATPLHHPPPTSHTLYRISSRRTKVAEDISLLSAKLVGFKCCFAELSLLVSEHIPNVACFKLCPSGGFVSGNRLMSFASSQKIEGNKSLFFWVFIQRTKAEPCRSYHDT